MEVPNEMLPGDDYTLQIAETLTREASLSPPPPNTLRLPDLEYTNIMLSNRAAGISDAPLTPDLRLRVVAVSALWPGGHPSSNHTFESTLFDPATSTENAMEMAVYTRQVILGASIGAAALDRIPHHLRQEQRRYNEITKHKPVEVLSWLCANAGFPLVLCSFGEIIEGIGRAPGERVAYMYYPRVLSSVRALKVLQGAVQEVVAQETLGPSPTEPTPDIDK